MIGLPFEPCEPDRLLAWFRKEAGLAPKAEAYKGWERQTIAGHSLGHYLSACSMMVAATGDDSGPSGRLAPGADNKTGHRIQ